MEVEAAGRPDNEEQDHEDDASYYCIAFEAFPKHGLLELPRGPLEFEGAVLEVGCLVCVWGGVGRNGWVD